MPLKNYIYAACGALITQHPSLSAIAVGEDTNNPLFVRLPEISLDECVLFQDRRRHVPTSSSSSTTAHDGRDVELDELLSSQHNTPFTPPAPFWRLCILTDPGGENPYRFTAAFVFHHAIGDGMSGAAFHRAFYHALSQAVQQPPLNDLPSDMVTVPSPQTPLHPNVEEIHSLPVTYLHLVTVLFREKLWAAPRDPELWTGAKIITPLDTQVRSLRVSRSATRALADLCRANGTTVGAALQTLVAGALFIYLPENFTKLHCACPVSMRRWLSHSIVPKDAAVNVDDCMGVWVQDSSEDYSRDKFPSSTCLPWDEARRSRSNIEHVLSLQAKNAGVSLLRYMRDYQRELFLPKVGQERESSYEVSNLGAFRTRRKRLEDRGQDQPEIGQMVFSQSGSVTGSAMSVSAITGEDGCLTLAFSRQKGVVEDDLIESVMETVREEITQLGNADD